MVRSCASLLQSHKLKGLTFCVMNSSGASNQPRVFRLRVYCSAGRDEEYLQHRLFRVMLVAKEALTQAALVLHRRKLHRAARCLLTALAILKAPQGEGGVHVMAQMLRTLDSAARLANMTAHAALGAVGVQGSSISLDLVGDTLSALQGMPPPPDFSRGVREAVMRGGGLFDPLESTTDPTGMPRGARGAPPTLGRQASSFAVQTTASAPSCTVDGALKALVAAAVSSKKRHIEERGLVGAELERGGAYSPPSPLQECEGGEIGGPYIPPASLLGGIPGAGAMTPRSQSRQSTDGGLKMPTVHPQVRAVDSPGVAYTPSAHIGGASSPSGDSEASFGDAAVMSRSQTDALMGSVGQAVGATRRVALAQLSMVAHARHSATVAALPAYLLGLRVDGDGQVLPAEIRRYTAGGKVRVKSDEQRALPPSLRTGTFQYRYIMGYEWGETKDTGATQR
jgi:hypothetical protein